MRILLFISVIIFSFSATKELAAQTAINTNGVYVPRLTTVQRNAIANPATGQMIYNTDDNCFNFYQNYAWKKLCGFDVTITGAWTPKANFGGSARKGAVGFAIGSKGYIGTGEEGSTLKKDFWEYNPSTNVWTQKADFGGESRERAVGFSIGSKGYIGTGRGTTPKNDFWEYDPTSNVWTQKTNFLGSSRFAAVGFSLGGKGYIGTGFSTNVFYDDFWEYNPGTNGWEQSYSFGGNFRAGAFGFSIGSKGYAGTGLDDNYQYKDDFWEFNPSDGWTQKANFGGGGRMHAAGFSIGNNGYAGTGDLNQDDFWEYDPTNNAWTKKAKVEGGNRSSAVGFPIGNRGYIGTGSANNDFWEFSPNVTNITEQGNQFNGNNQLVKLDAGGNLTNSGNLTITGNITVENFIAPTLENGWINYDVGAGYAAAGYFKNKHSVVKLKGLIKSGTTTSSTVLFNLPYGYRPAEIMVFSVINGSSTFGRVDVYPDGNVKIINGGNSFLSLDNISFRASH